MSEQTKKEGKKLEGADAGVVSLLQLIPAPVLAAANLRAIGALQKRDDVPLITTIAPLTHAFGHLFERFVAPELNRLVKDEATRKLPETQLAVYYAGLLTSLMQGEGDGTKASEAALSGFPGASVWRSQLNELTGWITTTALEAAKIASENEPPPSTGETYQTC